MLRHRALFVPVSSPSLSLSACWYALRAGGQTIHLSGPGAPDDRYGTLGRIA